MAGACNPPSETVTVDSAANTEGGWLLAHAVTAAGFCARSDGGCDMPAASRSPAARSTVTAAAPAAVIPSLGGALIDKVRLLSFAAATAGGGKRASSTQDALTLDSFRKLLYRRVVRRHVSEAELRQIFTFAVSTSVKQETHKFDLDAFFIWTHKVAAKAAGGRSSGGVEACFRRYDRTAIAAQGPHVKPTSSGGGGDGDGDGDGDGEVAAGDGTVRASNEPSLLCCALMSMYFSCRFLPVHSSMPLNSID